MGLFGNLGYKAATSSKSGKLFNKLFKKYLEYPSNENYNVVIRYINDGKVTQEAMRIIVENDFKNYALELNCHQQITSDQWNNFKVICDKFNITISYKEYQILFNKFAVWCLENYNSLPVSLKQNTDILLKSGEILYYSTPASIRKYKTKTTGVGYAGPSISIPIVKGVRYRVGSMKVARQTETTLENTDTGYFYITNKRVLFVGTKENFAYPIGKLIKIGNTDEGLLLHKENTVNPKILGVTNYDLALSVLSSVVNEEQLQLFNDNIGTPPADTGETLIQTQEQNDTFNDNLDDNLSEDILNDIKKKRIIVYILLLLPLPIIFTDPTHPYLPLGLLGLHRFYLKEYKYGILFLLTAGVFGFGFLYDLITSWKRIKSKVLDIE